MPLTDLMAYGNTICNIKCICNKVASDRDKHNENCRGKNEKCIGLAQMETYFYKQKI